MYCVTLKISAAMGKLKSWYCCWGRSRSVYITLLMLYWCSFICNYRYCTEAAASISSAPANSASAAATSLTLEVLLAFRYAITQDPRRALTSWGNSTSIGNTSSAANYCSWEGVLCHASNQQVKGIFLADLELEGTITPMLGRLTHLSYLNLSFNNLSGGVPAELGSCVTLLELSLNDNQLEGALPVELNNLTRLQILSASNNALKGPLPRLLLPALQQLDLSTNSLQGELTSLLPGCSGLRVLNLSSNHLEGPIPDSIGNLSQLVYLDLADNSFISISPFIANCSHLYHLNLYTNLIVGSVPSFWFSGLSRLSFLWLGANQFTGTLPSNIATLSQLQSLDLQVNNFQGPILQHLLNCSSLTYLYLYKNNFTERIPAQLGSSMPNLVQLVLEINLFYGPFPASLGNCSNLVRLNMGFNYGITGPFPKQILGLGKLVNLDLQWNLFRGAIPAEIGNLSSALEILILNHNNFTGRLPPQLGLLRNLLGVTFEENQFSGSIPQELGNCTKMLHLIAHHNLFSGAIPSFLGHDNQLEWLALYHNQLSGSIPTSLLNCTHLSQLNLSHNLLEGNILAGPFPFMQMLDLSNNGLSGPIPPELLASMPQLTLLDLSLNKLSGSLPASLANCVTLSFLDLSSNRLTGSLSIDLGNSLRSLVDFNLSHNSISGPIPPEFANLTYLQALDLSFNNLSGSIPSSLSLLANLISFNVSYNSLEGAVPENGAFRFFAAASFLGNPRLCGPLLHTPCHAEKGSHSRHSALFIGLIVAGSLLLLLLLTFTIALLVWWPRATRATDIKSPFLRLSLEEIQKATNNFSPENIVGSGGTSIVYKGTTRDGRNLAFKKMLVSRGMQESSFFAEIKSVGQVRHRNLVKVLGYFSDLEHDILFLDYMVNGNLSDRLHQNRNVAHGPAMKLSWNDRLEIAKGIAAGLAYLHHACPTPIIHLDVKPTNILLDDDMNPRISDFGLARLMQEAATHESTQNAKGSLCYMAPEYASFGKVSKMCDVYSYGIVLLEIVTGRSPTHHELFDNGQTLRTWAHLNVQSGDEIKESFLNLCLDTHYYTYKEKEEVILLLNMALLCTKENPKERPTMQKVVEHLECKSFSFETSSIYQQQVDFIEKSKRGKDVDVSM